MNLKSKASAFWKQKTKDNATFPVQNNPIIKLNHAKLIHFDDLRSLLSFVYHRFCFMAILASLELKCSFYGQACFLNVMKV